MLRSNSGAVEGRIYIESQTKQIRQVLNGEACSPSCHLEYINLLDTVISNPSVTIRSSRSAANPYKNVLVPSVEISLESIIVNRPFIIPIQNAFSLLWNYLAVGCRYINVGYSKLQPWQPVSFSFLANSNTSTY